MSNNSNKYITLISDSSHAYFPENKPNKFTVKLSEELRFYGSSYEVALREIHLPTAYNNIRKNMDNKFYIGTRHPNSPFPKYDEESIRFIKAGFYESVETLVYELNKTINMGNIAKFGYDSIRRKVFIRTSDLTKDEFLYIRLPYGLARALGFDEKKEEDVEIKIDVNSVKEAKRPPLLNIDQVYIYSNIVEPSVVSDYRAHLLRVVNLTGSKGHYLTKEFKKPIYIPLQSAVIRYIDIEITTNDGHLFSLDAEGSQVVLILHFRKKSPFTS